MIPFPTLRCTWVGLKNDGPLAQSSKTFHPLDVHLHRARGECPGPVLFKAFSEHVRPMKSGTRPSLRGSNKIVLKRKYGGPARLLVEYPAGITAISPGLSAATPGDSWHFVTILKGSQRHSHKTSGIPSGCGTFLRRSGGVTSFNPRLMAAILSGSNPRRWSSIHSREHGLVLLGTPVTNSGSILPLWTGGGRSSDCAGLAAHCGNCV